MEVPLFPCITQAVAAAAAAAAIDHKLFHPVTASRYDVKRSASRLDEFFLLPH
jgi:hypothetical protein